MNGMQAADNLPGFCAILHHTGVEGFQPTHKDEIQEWPDLTVPEVQRNTLARGSDPPPAG